MDSVFSCGRGRDGPCFMDSAIERAALAPCSEKGLAGTWVLLWQGLLRPAHRSWSSLPVSHVRVSQSEVGETDQQGK